MFGEGLDVTKKRVALAFMVEMKEELSTSEHKQTRHCKLMVVIGLKPMMEKGRVEYKS